MNNISARDTLIEQIKKSNNILIALNANPNIDELSSALGLNLILNKTNAHVTTIFSGQTPNVLKFLNPDAVFDRTVDGLRDFIIALDPAKADYVRTKVVDGMVRVSITPSKAAVTVDDLEFSQGDYNVDLVIALGVKDQNDLDQALQAHGRILHNAYVASISIGSMTSELGNLNWQEPTLQSFAQVVADLSLSLEPRQDDDKPSDGVIIDSSVATALMTALVAVTDRFSNVSTTPEVMSLAAVLMEQGANQQLISAELEASKKIETRLVNEEITEQVPVQLEPVQEPAPAFDQATKIDHLESETDSQSAPSTETDQSSIAEPISSTSGQTKPDPESLQSDMVTKIDQIIDQIADTDKDLLTQPVTNTQKLEISTNSTDDSLVKLEVQSEVVEQKNDSAELEKASVDQPIETAQEETNSVEAPIPNPTVDSPLAAAPLPSSDEPELVLPKIKMPPRKITKDSESWNKVNKFKQAFANRLKETQQVDQLATEQESVSDGLTKAITKEAEKSAETKQASGKSTGSKYNERLKKKPTKVIEPPVSQSQTGPTVAEQIDQELTRSNMPPMPTIPSDMPLPPMPPMPPEIDPMTMTSLPPMGQPDLTNNPFNDLETPNLIPPMPPIPTPPSFDQGLIPQPPILNQSDQNPQSLVPTPQISQPEPPAPAPTEPVSENQFVIPE
ncbi:MAG: hypothetical protein Q3996_00625 [Candidatus Saccharibacteria bacterium]|nr:hypothetical protein [Candidatus Saccharibacteria bacterium]